MKQTAVEWLEDCLTEQHPNGSFVWNTRADLEALFKQAKEMEKEQGYSEEEAIENRIRGINVDTGFRIERSYSEEEVEEMFETLKRNSVNNVATISNVDLFISSWRKQFKKK